MKKWKQLLSSALTAIMLLSSAAIVQADDATASAETATMQVPLYQNGASSATNAIGSRAASNKEIIEKAIHDGLMSCEQNIDLEQYAIPASDIMKYFQNVINTSPELFYVQGRLSWMPTAQGTIDYIMPQYSANGTELEQQRTTYNRKMKEILDLVDSNWSDLEKIVFLHDYLAQNYVYRIDQTTDSNGSVITDNSNYDAYSFLTEGNGVCQAYTLVYLGLLKEVGITASVASSPAMNHIWNLVLLNGKWYHVDVTWDDPIPDSYGNANHNYLLLSDAAIQKTTASRQNPHYGWTADYQCTDTTYDADNYFWTQFSTPFKELNGTWYTVGFSGTENTCHLYSVDFANKSTTSVYNMGTWHVHNNPSSFWQGSYSGLNTYGDKLYFNTSSAIMSYDPAKSGNDAFETVYSPTTEKSIYGMLIQGSAIRYNLKTQSFENGSVVSSANDIQTYSLPELPPPVPSEPLSPGDIDGDKKITINDAFIVLKGVIGAYTMSDAQQTAANMNNDTVVNLDDVKIILRIAMRIDTLEN